MISVIVPTEVPIAVDTKQAITKIIATANFAGTMLRRKYATLCAPLLPTMLENIPAVKKIRTIIIMFLSPTPCPITVIFFVKVEGFVLEYGDKYRREENGDDGNVIKPHFLAEYVLKKNAEAEIQYKEYADRKQCFYVAFFHFFFLLIKLPIKTAPV